MVSLSDAGDMNIARWTPEERAAKQAKLASQTLALRNAQAGIGSPGGVSGGVQQATPGPLGMAQQRAAPATATPPKASLSDANLFSSTTPQSQQATQPATLNGYQATGIGQGTQGGQIFSRVGQNGVTEFTNQGTAQAQPISLETAGQNIGQQPAMTSLSQIGSAGGQTDSPNKTFADLGSSSNMGNGVGSFSQNTAGDAALANSRFERANQIRRDGANQDRLDLALARQGNADQVTVVRDSSRSPSLGDVIMRRQDAAQDTAKRQSRLEDAGLAQGVINNTQAQRDQQLTRDRASRLDDLQSAAIAPGATAEDQAAYRRAYDPTGQKEAERLKTQAETSRADAQARKANTEATKGGVLPASLQKQEDSDIETVGLSGTVNGELSRYDKMIEDGSLQLGPYANITSSVRNGTGMSDEASQNYASFNAALEKIRNDTLRLNKGQQTEGDAERAMNELVTNINDPKVVRQRLAEIQKLNSQAAALRTGVINNRRQAQGVQPIDMDSIFANQRQIRAGGGNQQSAQQAPAAGPVRIASPADLDKLSPGTRFVSPDGVVREKR